MELKDIGLPIKDDLKGVYFLFDENKELLYVGKTNNFKTRLKTHLSSKKRVTQEEVLHKKTNVTSQVPFNSIKYYYFIEINDVLERDKEELRYIKLFKPRFNRPYLFSSWKEINKLTFESYQR